MIKQMIARNAACNAVTSLVDQGSLWSAGRLQIYNDSSTILASLPLSNPAFSDSTDSTAVANYITDSTALVDGTASWFAITNRDATSIWTGSVVRTGYVGDMHLNQVVFLQDQTVSITSATYIVPA